MCNKIVTFAQSMFSSQGVRGLPFMTSALGYAHQLRSDFENRGILRNFCLRKPCLCCLETEFQRKQGSWHGWLQIVSYATFFMAIWITTLTDLTTTLLSRLLSIEDEHDTGLPAYSDGAGLGHWKSVTVREELLTVPLYPNLFIVWRSNWRLRKVSL